MAMNLFRLIGDFSRNASIMLILYRLRKQQNGTDISIKTQEFFCLVYLSRYLDFWSVFYSIYLSSMKALYTTSALYILMMLHVPSGNLRYTLRRDEDVSRRSFVLVPCAVFGLIWCFGRSNIYFGALEYFWTFSIMLEPVAMIPQLLIVQRKRCNLDKGIQFYCLFQFLSRFFYILNWIYRSWTEPHFFYPFIYYIGGFVHCLLIALPWIWKKLNMDPFHLLESVPKATNDDAIEEELSFIYHLIVDTDTGNGV